MDWLRWSCTGLAILLTVVFVASALEKLRRLRDGTSHLHPVFLRHALLRKSPRLFMGIGLFVDGVTALLLGLGTVTGACFAALLVLVYSSLGYSAFRSADTPCSCTGLKFFEVASRSGLLRRNAVLFTYAVVLFVGTWEFGGPRADIAGGLTACLLATAPLLAISARDRGRARSSREGVAAHTGGAGRAMHATRY